MKPNIFQFRSCRPFLRAAIEHYRSVDRKYSLAYFSARIGHSSAYLKLVLSGKRELSLDAAASLGRALKLNAVERAYLVNLTLKESASSAALRTYAANQLISLKKEGMSYQPSGKLSSIFENSLVWEIFSLVGVSGFEATPEWIVPRLRRRDKSPAAVVAALKQLEALGAIVRENGRLRAGDVVLKHGFDVNRIYAVALRRALDHLAQVPNDSSAYFDSFCLILGDDEYEQVREILEEAKLKVGQVARGRSSPKTRIAYFNTSLFRASD